MKVQEQQLNNHLYYFKNKNCIIKISGACQVTFEVYRVNIWYDKKIGIIFIRDTRKVNKLNINITEIKLIDINKNVVIIQLDELTIRISTQRSNRWRK